MKTVIEMAREAGFRSPASTDGYMGLAFDQRKKGEIGGSLERFAELVRIECNLYLAEMQEMEGQLNILNDALAKLRQQTIAIKSSL